MSPGWEVYIPEDGGVQGRADRHVKLANASARFSADFDGVFRFPCQGRQLGEVGPQLGLQDRVQQAAEGVELRRQMLRTGHLYFHLQWWCIEIFSLYFSEASPPCIF